MEAKMRRVAFYARVSSEEQRDRQTIKTQVEFLKQRLSMEPGTSLMDVYADDGVSGAIFLAERPQGKKLLEDARMGRFDEIWVYKLDRLARDEIDALILRRDLQRLNIKVVSACENIQGDLDYGIRAILAGEERRVFMTRSADGMNRAAREGRYTGGIVPLGYKVEGKKQKAFLVPCEDIMWSDLTEAGVVRRVYHHLVVDGWSCVRIAKEFNGLGIPTDYALDNREVGKGERRKHTQGVWRPGRIRNLVVNPVYKGELLYGRRSYKPSGREVIKSTVPALVSAEMWDAAQEALRRNRTVGPASGRVYILKSVMKCGICGLTYVGSWNRNSVYYRCGGHLTGRGPTEGKCNAKDIKGDNIEPIIKADIEAFLRNPGDIIKELSQERETDSAAAIREAEKITLEGALANLAIRRKNAIDLRMRGRITDAEIDEALAQVDKEKAQVEERLKALTPVAVEEEQEPLTEDILAELRKRLDAELTPLQWQEIVRLLVKRITIYTEGEGLTRKARAVIEYRFTPPSPSEALVAVPTCTGTGSSRRQEQFGGNPRLCDVSS